MYNTNMNFRVAVDSSQKNIAKVIQWANDYIGSDEYKCNNDFPNFNWFFEFNNSKHANFFALKWA